MNLSGKAVNYWMRAEKIPLENVLIITDDIALPLGSLRLKTKGRDGGHNGLKSISETLGTEEFARLRVGVEMIFRRANKLIMFLENGRQKKLLCWHRVSLYQLILLKHLQQLVCNEQ